ncbi:MAG: hypothetical protein ACRDJO_13565 [Actinomycetota bacterium]
MATSAIVEVSCPSCGAVALPTGMLSCGIAPDGSSRGLCQFTCPLCTRLVFLSTGHRAANLLLEEGARPFAGPAPFELLEEHAGAAVTYDDILEFHSAISADPFPQEELVAHGGPGPQVVPPGVPAIEPRPVSAGDTSTNARRIGRLRARRRHERT